MINLAVELVGGCLNSKHKLYRWNGSARMDEGSSLTTFDCEILQISIILAFVFLGNDIISVCSSWLWLELLNYSECATRAESESGRSGKGPTWNFETEREHALRSIQFKFTKLDDTCNYIVVASVASLSSSPIKFSNHILEMVKKANQQAALIHR